MPFTISYPDDTRSSKGRKDYIHVSELPTLSHQTPAAFHSCSGIRGPFSRFPDEYEAFELLKRTLQGDPSRLVPWFG